jgi:hypothetical protein
MRTARFWTGVAILTGLALAILITISGSRVTRSGPVTGTVFFHGRPLACGLIYFNPEDAGRGECTCSVIDEDGRFECDLEWRRDRADRMRFRISIVPGPRNYPLSLPAGDPNEGPGSDDAAGPVPTGDGHRGIRIVRASLGSEDLPSLERSVKSGRWPVSSRGMIIEREVSLGPEPVHIELDLRD